MYISKNINPGAIVGAPDESTSYFHALFTINYLVNIRSPVVEAGVKVKSSITSILVFSYGFIGLQAFNNSLVSGEAF